VGQSVIDVAFDGNNNQNGNGRSNMQKDCDKIENVNVCIFIHGEDVGKVHFVFVLFFIQKKCRV